MCAGVKTERPESTTTSGWIAASYRCAGLQAGTAPVEDLGANGLMARCITGHNSGPPMTPGFYNNNVQVFQTPDHVALLNEMNHNVRVVPLDGRPHVDLPQWTGDSRGHWDGDSWPRRAVSCARPASRAAGPGRTCCMTGYAVHSVWTRPWT